ncbi:hypothetical protein [Myxococcus stipitatus]|nr:hypothetical protein [Myxococcus stipitatus]
MTTDSITTANTQQNNEAQEAEADTREYDGICQCQSPDMTFCPFHLSGN